MGKVFALIGRILDPVIGHFSWTSPPWAKILGTKRKEHPKAFWIATLCLLTFVAATAGGYWYYSQLPKPALVTAEAIPPSITPLHKDAKPYPLRVVFKLNGMTVSAASLDSLNKEVTGRIQMKPAFKGKWRWSSENTLTFTPDKDWPAGQQYTLQFDPGIFSEDIKLESYDASFTTPAFKASVSEFRFYQDPKDRNIRKVVATLTFTHPVDEKSLAERILLTMWEKGEAKRKKPYPFNISYDDKKRRAYVHSEPLTLTEDENFMHLDVNNGVRPVYGPSATKQELHSEVKVPSIYSYFRVSRVHALIVRNKDKQNRPEQTLLIEFTDGVKSKELRKNFKAYLLPVKRYKNRNYTYHWRSASEVTPDVLLRAKPLAIEALPTDREYATLHSFRLDAPEGRYIYVRQEGGLKSEGGFYLARPFVALARVPAYPKEIKIAFDGSLVPLSGSKKVTVLSRGLKALKVEIGRLLPGQVNHLVSQTSGDIRNPYFRSYSFKKENISQIFSEIQDVNSLHPSRAMYSTVDISRYLNKARNRMGIFFVRVQGWDRQHKRPVYGIADKRLIMVSNLGILVKTSADRSHEVFVQSIVTGLPADKARVQVLGANGLPVIEKTTGPDGHVAFPKLDDFKGAQAPTVYLVSLGSDLSFIPYARSGRNINYSRFNVGGVHSRYAPKRGLNAFVFSDRGIYRPGDTVHLGSIVREKKWKAIGGIPLEIDVHDPRGARVLRKKIKLPTAGFFEIDYVSDEVALTGNYNARVYLINAKGRRESMIGSATFRVEEFQPDRMKIRARITGKKRKGWMAPEGLTGKVVLENLFGTPAQNRVIRARMTLIPSSFGFTEYKNYAFLDPLIDPKKRRLRVSETLKPAKTGTKGSVEFELPLERFTGGTYRLVFEAEGFESGGGRSVRARVSTLISPLDYLVGFKADGKLAYIHQGSKRSIAWISINPDLKKIASSDLQLRLVEKRYVSTLVKQPDGTYKYQSVLKKTVLETQAFSIPQEGRSYALPTKHAGDFVIELVNDKGIVVGRVPFSVAGEGNLARSLEKNAELNVKLDKKSYKAGDTIEMHITAPYTGAGLITIEREKVFAFKWFRTGKTSTVQHIKVPRGFEGNGYVNITFVRSLGSREIYTSPLSYAAIPFDVGLDHRRIKVDLSAAEMVKPGQPLHIRYKASKPARIVIYAVDEGILQVARYKTPRPLRHFFRKQALEVNTSQIVDLILPAYELAMELAAAGGGDAEEYRAASAKRALGRNLNPFRRLTQKPVVFWSGIVEAGEKEREVAFDVPDYFNGNLKVMAVAVSKDAVGTSDKPILVKGPFVLSPNVPLAVTPGDVFDVTVGVANNVEGSGEKASITVSLAASEHLQVLGGDKHTIIIPEEGEGRVRFRIKAKDTLGGAEMMFMAGMGEESAKLKATLSVRPAMPYMTSFSSGHTPSGKVDIAIKRVLYTQFSEQSASASYGPLVIVEGLASYLKHFAHGCIEQMVSKVFPYMAFLRHPGYQVDRVRLDKDFGTLIMALRSRQTAQGGFSFWPGYGQPAEFPSVYIMHFLTEARELGLPVPRDVFRRGLAYLQIIAARQAKNLPEARLTAYAIYMLTRNRHVTSNYLFNLHAALERMQKKQQLAWMDDITSTYMAASYKMLKDRRLAAKTLEGYQFGADKQGLVSDFDGNLVQDAQYIYLLARHFPERLTKLKSDDIMRLVHEVTKGNYNTLSSSFTMIALGAYTSHAASQHADADIAISEKNAKGEVNTLKVTPTPFAKVMFTHEARQIQMAGKSGLFYVVSQAGFDRKLPDKEIRDGLEIQRHYVDAKGKVLTTARLGEEVKVRIRIRALGDRMVTNVAIIDLLPGGFEAVRDSLAYTRSYKRGWTNYHDVREDRVVIYGSYGPGITEITYKARVTAEGDFTIPPIFAGSMYNRHVRARSLPGKFGVSGY